MGNTQSISPWMAEMKHSYLFLCERDNLESQRNSMNKKLMTKNLKRLLVDISSKKMEAQKDELLTFLTSWKGNNQQVDDISLIAIKVV